MGSKTFWIINQTAGSPHHGMVYRNYYIAKEWVRQGRKAVIISSSYFHNFTKFPETKGLFTREMIDGIEYWWVKMPRYSQSRSFGRLLSIFLFPMLLMFFPFWRLAKPDTIIVSGPPHVPILNAWLWSRALGATLVYEVRDIWPLTIQKLGGISRWHPVILLLSFFERLAYMSADRVVSVLSLAFRHFESRGMLPAKFAYIPNGVDVSQETQLESETSRKILELSETKKIVIYTGSFGIANNLDQLLCAAESLKARSDIHFVFVGDGPHRAKLLEKAKSLPNVTFFGSVPKKEISAILAKAHMGYVGLMKSDLFSHGVSPNKLFDYMAAELPVIMAIDTEDNIVGKAQCGEFVPSCEPRDIVTAIEKLCSLTTSELKAMGKRGRDYLEKHHTYSALAKQYVEVANLGKRPVEEAARWVASPFWIGLMGVLLLGAIFHLVLPLFAPHLFADGMTIFLKDAHTYHRLALEVAHESWSEFSFRPAGQFPAGILAFLYKLTSIHRPIVMLPLLGILAGLTIRAIASCLDVLGVRGRWWPLVIGISFTVTPTSFSWMIYPHKDAFIVPGVLLLAWTLMSVTLRRIRFRHFFSLLLGGFLVFTSKPYFAEIFIAGTVLALPVAWKYPASQIGRYGRMIFFGFALFLFVLVGFWKGGYSDAGDGVTNSGLSSQEATSAQKTPRHHQLKVSWENLPGGLWVNKPLYALAYTRERFLFEREHGNTNFMPETYLRSAKDTLLFIPRALQLALLEPLPWNRTEGGGARQLVHLALKAEMLFVYLSLLFLLVSGRKALTTPVLICLCLALPFLVALGFAAPNIGTINRYRFPFLILIKLAGFAALWAADRKSWPGRLLMWVDPPKTVREKKQLLFLVPDDETFIIQRLVMARSAQAGGYEVHVACPDLGHAQKIREMGFIHHEIDLNRGGLNPIADLFKFIRLVFLLAKLRPDILHNVSIKPVIYGSTAGTIVGLKRIVNLVNGLGYAFERQGLKGEVVHAVAVALYRNALALPGVRVIFQNPDDRQYFIDYRMVEEHKTILIRGSGVDMKKFAPTPLPQTDTPVVLFVGRLLWSKGIRELIQAAQTLKAEGLRFRLLIVGAPDERNPEAVSPAEMKRWHEQGVLEWLGRQSDMPKFYREASIVCLPTNYREGLPLTLLEAASIGRSLVATDIPGCREVVREGVNGFLVPPKNPEKLADALRKLLQSEELRQRFGKASTHLVETEFSSVHVQRQLLAVYDSLFDDAALKMSYSPVHA